MGDKLLRLSSGEILPNIPQTSVNNELRKYLGDLHDYLRRLASRMTAENISASGGALGVIDQWVYVTGEVTTKKYFTQQDLRGKFFWFYVEYITDTDTLSGGGHTGAERNQWNNSMVLTTPYLFGSKWNPGSDFNLGAFYIGGGALNMWLESGTGKIYYTVSSYSTPCNARIEFMFGPAKAASDLAIP